MALTRLPYDSHAALKHKKVMMKWMFDCCVHLLIVKDSEWDPDVHWTPHAVTSLSILHNQQESDVRR